MDNDDIEEYVQRSQSLLEKSPQMDEQNTRRKIIEPFLEILGWDMLSTNVELEYSVQMGVGTKKVDYAFTLKDTPVVFVEAKGGDTSLTSKHRDQLTSYMRQTGVDWGMLTNGKKLELFKRKQVGSKPDEIALGKFSIEELSDRTGLIRAFSRDSLESGESETIAENIETTRRAATELRNKKEEISTKVTNIVTDEIGDSVSQPVEDGAKEFVDVLASSLERQGRDEFTTNQTGPEISEIANFNTWDPGLGKNAIVGTMSRDDVDGLSDAKVAIFPTRTSGLKFLKENNAWGFVRVGQNPEYAAFYVAGKPMQIQYLAKIQDIIPAEEATLARDIETYRGEEAGYEPGDQVIVFEPSSLYQLSDPIEYKNKAPQGRVYTTLGRLKTAETTDDVI